ncbi:hypothetical protein NZD88_07500 [Chryseobacterium antibioticum]|uniref:Yip1 domain-containing protein n=1 Tax=Chryseobacterium pyrolae TaxID=2987481 RepID=A0ABT2IFH7_9FLAO|nr:hypothetical protein [Chryseobacterium pyrolae]MCT2407386.1 hypothetical protein [Chryseobacterium pyrolae]
MRNSILFFILILLYFTLTFLDKNFISTSSKIFDFLSKDYPSEMVQNYMESQKKWWWVSYATIPLLIGIKILLVTFCLNFIKLFDLPGLEKVKFSDIITLVLIAEFVFIIAGFYKFVNFYWIDTDYTLENLQTYYPISLLNIKEYISAEKWLAYPLQLVNLFELFYWGILAWGIWELSEQKISFKKSFGLTTITYGIGLLFWVGVVSFFILNAQY